MNIPGEDLSGVSSGLKFLKDFNFRWENVVQIAKKLVVVGGGQYVH